MAIIRLRSTSRRDARMVVERSEATAISTSPGRAARSSGSSARTRSTVSMMLAFGSRDSRTSTAGAPSAMPWLRRFSTESSTSAISDRRTGRAVAIGDHQRPVLLGLARLVVDIDLEPCAPLLDGAFRAVGIGGGQRGPHVLEPDAVFEQGVRLQLDPHGRKRAAAEIDLADAFHLREFLLKDGGRGIVERARGSGYATSGQGS